MIKIVTVEREYGSGGSEIAQWLATRLGWKLWDQLLTEEIARLAHCPQAVVEEREERTDPLYYRLMKSFMRGSYEGSLNAPKLNLVDSESILRITQRVVLHAARNRRLRHCRKGIATFSSGAHRTLRVLPYAPRENKVRRLISRGKSETEAQELADTVDRERADFIAKYFGVEWPNRVVYHSMINTAIGDEMVVHTILDFMKTMDAKASVLVGSPG